MLITPSRPRFFILLLLLAELGTASPTAKSSPDSQDNGSSASSYMARKDALMATTPTPVLSTRVQRMPHQTRSDNVYALDPFGIIGSNQPGETRTRNDSAASSKSISSKTEITTDLHGSTTSSTASASTISTTSSNAPGATEKEPIPPSSIGMTSTEVSGDSATPTDKLTPKQTAAGNTSQASSGMNSWKIIGIGIVTFVGVLTLIIGFTFHDTWWNKLLRPIILGKRNKDCGTGEELIPDWKRRSWGFDVEEKEGIDCYQNNFKGTNALKVNISQGLYSSGTLVNGEELDEKPREVMGNLAFPLPPVSPFPLRRTPSTKSNPECKVDVDSDNQGVKQLNASILPSPPPVHAPVRNSLNAIGLPSIYQYSQNTTTNQITTPTPKNNRRSTASLRGSKLDFGRVESVYGGIA